MIYSVVQIGVVIWVLLGFGDGSNSSEGNSLHFKDGQFQGVML